MPLARTLNVVEAILVDRYGDEVIEHWLSPPPAPTPATWGTGDAAAAGQQAFMDMIGGAA